MLRPAWPSLRSRYVRSPRGDCDCWREVRVPPLPVGARQMRVFRPPCHAPLGAPRHPCPPSPHAPAHHSPLATRGPQLTAPLPKRTHANARAFPSVHHAFKSVSKQQFFSPATHVGSPSPRWSFFCATHWPTPSKLGARNSQLNPHRTPPHVRCNAVTMRWSADPCCVFFRPTARVVVARFTERARNGRVRWTA